MKTTLLTSIVLVLVQVYLSMYCENHRLAAVVVVGCITGWMVRGQYDAYRLKKLGEH